jgi:mono/diheme cytochrome c family protein
LILAVLLALFSLAPGRAQQDSSTPAAGDEAEHGRYLVHQVCLCIVCHSPRDARGKLIQSQLLTGGTIPLSSPYPGVDWAFRAPKIAGLPAGWSEAEFVHFLKTREAPLGRSVRPPMPPFRLNDRDALAIAAYLKSLR